MNEIDMSSDNHNVFMKFHDIGKEYRLKSYQKLFIESLQNNKHEIINENAMNNIKSTKVDTTYDKFIDKISKLEEIKSKLESEKKRELDIQEKNMKVMEVLKENRSNEENNQLKRIQNDNTLKDIETLDHENIRLNELINSLKYLTGINNISFVKPNSINGKIGIQMELNSIYYILTIDNDMKLIEIVGNNNESKLLFDKIIKDSKHLNPPHDLRYAIFVLIANQQTINYLSNHIHELRNSCLITHVYDKMRFINQVSITVESGLQAVVNIHECYPKIPKSVSIESLSNCTLDVTNVINDINSNGFYNIIELFNYLNQL